MSKTKYFTAIEKILEDVNANETIWLEELLDNYRFPKVAFNTKKKYLREYIEENPKKLKKISGFYPSAVTIVNLVESELAETISETNLNHANKMARDIVNAIAKPMLENYLVTSLDKNITNGNVSITISKLMDFLQLEFTEFLSSSGNGLQSIAGSLNEHLLQKAMTNAGMDETQFQKTGKDSNADFKIYSNINQRKQLGVEVKSYHARERLLRGLQDIVGHKVGFGFFVDAGEFNSHRTQTLLQSETAAIYMPQSTLKDVEIKAQEMRTTQTIAFNSRFYRPIEQFVSDMKYFCTNDELPNFG